MIKPLAMLMLLAIGIFASCQSGSGSANLSAEEFDAKIKASTNAQVLDVRTPGEFQGGHLPNAINIDWNGDDFKTAVGKLDKTKPTFVYCLSGGRSSSAASAMAAMGFNNLYQLNGGIRAWMNAGKEITLPESARKAGMTTVEYTAQTNAADLVLVDFNAPWCGPCKKMAPLLEDLATQYKDKLKLVKINVDENKDVSNALKVEALPKLIIYEQGKVVWQHQGLAEKVEIEKELLKY